MKKFFLNILCAILFAGAETVNFIQMFDKTKSDAAVILNENKAMRNSAEPVIIEPKPQESLPEEKTETTSDQSAEANESIPLQNENHIKQENKSKNESNTAPKKTPEGSGSSVQQTQNSSSTSAPAPSKNSSSPANNNSSYPSGIDSGTLNFSDEVVRLCNEERAKNSLPALLNNDTNLQNAANLRADEVKTNFSHTRPDGTSCFTVLPLYGVTYTAAGENIAYGQKNPSDVVTSWMNSEGHRANILSSAFTHIAVGFSANYWVQLFIKK